MGKIVDADELYAAFRRDIMGGLNYDRILREAKPVDAVPVVRCKDCKHRPTGTNRDDLEFPDDKCPCQCEDFWYSWKPSDDWFCGNSERKDGDHHDKR